MISGGRLTGTVYLQRNFEGQSLLTIESADCFCMLRVRFCAAGKTLRYRFFNKQRMFLANLKNKNVHVLITRLGRYGFYKTASMFFNSDKWINIH